MIGKLVNSLTGTISVLRCLLFPRKWLVAGPYTGELGWEMMVWQGYVRAIGRRYSKVLVISYPSSSVLYENSTFVAHDKTLIESGFGLGAMSRRSNQELIRNCVRNRLASKEYDIFLPNDLNRITRRLLLRPIFVRLKAKRSDATKFDIVFHFRDFERPGDKRKSYPHAYANRLFMLCAQGGLTCVCIGHPDMSYCPEGCEDRRSLDMAVAIDVISNSHVIVGGSSSPMHLASLCAKPIVVWIGDGADIERYISYWNPHKSPVYVVTDKSFQPAPEDVFEMLSIALKDVAK